MTLISIIIQLTPTEPDDLREIMQMKASGQSLGRATHAWFMDRVREHDQALATRLHEPNVERPFTASNLWRARESVRRTHSPSHPLTLPPSHAFNLRITSYSPELTALLEERLLPALPERVTLAGVKFLRGEVIRRPEDTDVRGLQPWVGRTTFEALVAAHTLQDPMPARVTLRFASPTVFKSQGAFMPLPLPRLVFEGLVRRWNAWSPVQVHPDVNQYAEEGMAISRYRLRTETVRFGGRALPGFVGSCTYALRLKDRYWMGLVHLLAGFALYAGVGKQTTMGMGQVRGAWEGGRGRAWEGVSR